MSLSFTKRTCITLKLCMCAVFKHDGPHSPARISHDIPGSSLYLKCLLHATFIFSIVKNSKILVVQLSHTFLLCLMSRFLITIQSFLDFQDNTAYILLSSFFSYTVTLYSFVFSSCCKRFPDCVVSTLLRHVC